MCMMYIFMQLAEWWFPFQLSSFQKCQTPVTWEFVSEDLFSPSKDCSFSLLEERLEFAVKRSPKGAPTYTASGSSQCERTGGTQICFLEN